jgi:hypothetical protein
MLSEEPRAFCDLDGGLKSDLFVLVVEKPAEVFRGLVSLLIS